MIQNTAALRGLNGIYAKPGSQIVVFYGREGCGKELYIRHFLKGKAFFYYRAREISAEEQKRVFLSEVMKQYHIDPEEAEFDLDICFRQMQAKDGSKLVIVMDEFEHLIRKNSEFLESFVKLRQESADGGAVMLLLCSSSLVFVEHKMAPLMGKSFYEIDTIHKIAEMNFIDVVRAFPQTPVSECVQLYGVLGGIPSYLKRWDAGRDVKDNICRNILSCNGSLFLEAERFLRMELRELSVYHTILTAMAAGYSKLNELHKYTGYSRAKVSVYLKNLMEFDVIEKVVSFETGREENAQKAVYRIKNTLIHFWFTFVFPHLSDLYLFQPEEFYELHIAGGLDSYLERYFVCVCMEYMKLMNRAGRLPIRIHKMGTWVGKQGTIDIVAQNSIREKIVGICNWSKEKMPYAYCERLEMLMGQAHIKANHYFLFSGKSFDPALRKLAEQDQRYTLIDMAQL